MADEESTPEEFDYALFIDGTERGIYVEDLELWEVEVIEETADCALEDIDWNRASTLRALAFILMRRDNPDFTMDDARTLKLKRLAKPEGPKPEKKPATKRPTKAAKAAATA